MCDDSVLVHLTELVESIEDDLLLPLRAHERENRGGFLSISRLVFCYVDYLGALTSNGTGKRTDRAVAYMSKYMVRANPAYDGKCDLMYDMWRNGPVHEYDAKRYVSANQGFELRWGANNTSTAANRHWHLKCMCCDGQPGRYHWFINLFELVEELRRSIRFLISDMESDSELLMRVGHNYAELSKKLDLDRRPKHMKQVALVIDAPAGVIDGAGNVIREFRGRDESAAFVSNEWQEQELT